MKRLLLSISFLFVLTFTVNAAHIIGGEMRYVYVGPGSSANSKVYRIVMILFRGDDPAGAPLATSYVVAIYNNDNGLKIPGTAVNSNWTISQDPPGTPSIPIIFPSCIQNPPVLNYTYATYAMTVELPDNTRGYTVTYQTCCRINGLANVANSTGSTYTCSIPGTAELGTGNDSSPAFGLPINVICRLSPFTLNFSAVDPDPGDSLVYSLCNAYNGGLAVNTGFVDPAPPPYGSATYLPGFSGANPMNTPVSINTNTGIITGTAPEVGKYVICVCIDIYREGVLIARHRKDLIVQVSDCSITSAVPMPSFVTCDGFNIQFSHSSTGATSVFWDFGDPTTLADTSNSDNPSWNYQNAGAGTYTVKFVINRGTSCSDSTTRTVGVFPGFFPGFSSAGACFVNPFQFTDTTRTNYGVVNSWSWNFGDETTLADTSHAQHPQWVYSTPGPKTVSLVVTNSMGCTNTFTSVINVLDKPILAVNFADTLICRSDQVQLGATGTGVFSWSPNTNMVNGNTANPTVNPTVTTWYYVQLTDNGCSNRDSVRVRVIPTVSLFAGNDTTICEGDAIQLNATSDGLQYIWTPAANLNDPTIQDPIAITNTTTTYTVVAIVGSCRATDSLTVFTVPYPVAAAGPDQTICYNTSAQLNGSHDGSSFSWSPVSYLNNPAILNPISSPPRTTTYVLTVFDTDGCPKPGRDTVVVTVQPKVKAYAGQDTTVVVGQPLQLQATGGVSYLWTPTTGFTTANNIPNPIAIYPSNIDSVRYKVIVRDEIGCADSAWVLVRIFKTVPSIFVPTAFTPNGDGLNDLARPIAVGMRRIIYFSIYNRWGELVFTTTENKRGWDGRINGNLQSTNVFVWHVLAEDYMGNRYFRKGTTTLIR